MTYAYYCEKRGIASTMDLPINGRSTRKKGWNSIIDCCPEESQRAEAFCGKSYARAETSGSGRSWRLLCSQQAAFDSLVRFLAASSPALFLYLGKDSHDGDRSQQHHRTHQRSGLPCAPQMRSCPSQRSPHDTAIKVCSPCLPSSVLHRNRSDQEAVLLTSTPWIAQSGPISPVFPTAHHHGSMFMLYGLYTWGVYPCSRSGARHPPAANTSAASYCPCPFHE